MENKNIQRLQAVRSKQKPKLGSGARFAALEKSLANRKGIYNPSGLAASIGRKKYGKAKFQKLAAKGRKSA
jgi:hypothetical protein